MCYFYQKTVNDTTVSSVSEQLLNVSRRAREFDDPLDVVYAAEVVDHLVQVIGRDRIVRNMQIITCTVLYVTVQTLEPYAQHFFKSESFRSAEW